MAPTPNAPPTSEIGYVNPSAGYGIGVLGGWVDDQAEETAACAYPESVRTFGLMRVDPTVHTVLSLATRPILRPGLFSLDPQGADPVKVLELAEDLDLPVLGMERPPPLRRRGRFSFREHLRLSLLDQVFGHMAFEQQCDKEILETTGQARLHKLAPRFPRSIAQIKVARDGGLEYIVQHRMGFEKVEPIPVRYLVWYAHDREGAAWQGRPPIRVVYGNWRRLDRLRRARNYLMERQSSGTPVGKAPPGGNQDDINAMRDIAVASRSGDQSGVGIPYGSELTFEGIRGTIPDVTAAIVDERAEMADALMVSWLRIGTSEASGNRALGQTFAEQYFLALDALAGTRADILTQHVVEDLWDWNYGNSEPAPAVVSRPVDAERDIEPEDLRKLLEVGAITPDESLEDLLRQRFKLPKRPAPEGDPEQAATGVRNLAVPEIIQKVYLGVGTMLSSDEARAIVNSAAGAEILPLPGPAFPARAPGVAAGRRGNVRQSYDSTRAAQVWAATAKDWRERVAEALSSSVDADAIAAAALDGSTPTTAVAAGLSIDDTTALAGLLVELWGDAYSEGVSTATTRAVVAAARRERVVMAGLSEMIAKAGEVARGILSSLGDRLAGALDSGDLPTAPDALADVLSGLGSDVAAAERIAVTETQRAMIAGAVDTWASMGIAETRWVRASGSGDADECADLDGTTSTSGWSSLPPLHPNCLCEIEPA